MIQAPKKYAIEMIFVAKVEDWNREASMFSIFGGTFIRSNWSAWWYVEAELNVETRSSSWQLMKNVFASCWRKVGEVEIKSEYFISYLGMGKMYQCLKYKTHDWNAYKINQDITWVFIEVVTVADIFIRNENVLPTRHYYLSRINDSHLVQSCSAQRDTWS